MKHKINMTFQVFTWQRLMIAAHIRKCIESTLQAEQIRVPCEINVLVTDDVGIHGINLASRNIDRPTDVLSFPLLDYEGESEEPFFDELCSNLGDIVISLERAMAQANEFGHSFEREVAFLTAHSMLHLLGYEIGRAHV